MLTTVGLVWLSCLFLYPPFCSRVGWHSEVQNSFCLVSPHVASVFNGRKVFRLGSCLKCPRGDKGSAETGNPRPVLYENSSIEQSLQRETGLISLRTMYALARTHTWILAHRLALLEENCQGKRWPQCETSVNKCAPEVKVQHTSIFSPASYSLQETFEALAGWYGFTLGTAKFVYTYSTIHQLILWCLEDVTDIHIGGCLSTHDHQCPLYMTS